MFDRLIQFLVTKKTPGFGTVYRFVRGNSQFIGKSKHGVRLHLDYRQYIDNEILRSGYFDETVLVAIMENLKDQDIVWDIGANIGLHSLTISKLNKTVKCFAFEPYHENFSRLSKNVQLNRNLEIRLYNIGISNSTSIVGLFSSEFNLGRTGFYEMKNTVKSNTYCMTISGDQLVEQHGFLDPDIIKLDTEGHELSILQGMKNILNRDTLKTIVFESFSDQDEIIDYLEMFRFNIDELDGQGNYVARKTSR